MDLGALGFWIFIAACVVAGSLSSSRRAAEKHETMRRILEKTGTIDEARLKELFKADPTSEWKPGSGYRALRITGTIVMFIAAGILIFFGVVAGLSLLFGAEVPSEAAIAIFAVPAGVAIVGYGLFYSSRFAEPPPGARNDRPAP
jgi:hypothetical protein